MPVFTTPGQTALTVIPARPRIPISAATVRVRPMTACFDAQYAEFVGLAYLPEMEAMLMIRPSLCSMILGRNALVQW